MNNHKMNRCTHEGIDELTTEIIAPAGAPRTSRTQGTEHVHTDMTALASGINTVPRTGAYQHMHACKGVSNSGNGHMHSPPRCRLGTFSISQPRGEVLAALLRAVSCIFRILGPSRAHKRQHCSTAAQSLASAGIGSSTRAGVTVLECVRM